MLVQLCQNENTFTVLFTFAFPRQGSYTSVKSYGQGIKKGSLVWGMFKEVTSLNFGGKDILETAASGINTHYLGHSSQCH